MPLDEDYILSLTDRRFEEFLSLATQEELKQMLRKLRSKYKHEITFLKQELMLKEEYINQIELERKKHG